MRKWTALLLASALTACNAASDEEAAAPVCDRLASHPNDR